MEKIGSFWTDTAMVLVGDPCQFLRSKWKEVFTGLGYDDYLKLWNNDFVNGKYISVPNNHDTQMAGMAILTGCDGWHHVYLERDEQGEPSKLVVDLVAKTKP